MDIKILAAVLTTLTAVFIAMNAGGGLQTASPNPGGLSGLIPDFFSSQPPEPETGVTAEIKVLEKNTTFNVNGDVRIKGLTTYISERVEIKSNNDIEFQNFNGKLRIGNNSKIWGNAEGFTSNGVQVAKTFRLEKELNTSMIEVKHADRLSLNFDSANIDLKAKNSSSSIQETNTTVKINSFSGNITVRPETMTIELDGNISVIEAGQTTFGN